MPRRARCAVLLGLALASAAWARADGLLDPRSDLYYRDPRLRDLMAWVTLQLTFDGDSLVPDMAAGDPGMTARGQPLFAPGVKGRALVAGDGSGQGIYARVGNAALETRGAVSLWVCPTRWTHQQGGNTTFLMTANSSFYLQRQGPMHNDEGVVTRQEGVQFLMLSEVTGNQCLMVGTSDWPQGQWRLLVANWSWPTMSLSLDGGEFRSVTVKQSPGPDQFGALVVGASGGGETLLDELTVYRRPLALEEVRALYEALSPRQTEGSE